MKWTESSEQLALPEAKYNLDIGSGTHGRQTGEMLVGIEKILRKSEGSQRVNLVDRGGFEPPTFRVQVGYSTTEPPGAEIVFMYRPYRPSAFQSSIWGDL